MAAKKFFKKVVPVNVSTEGAMSLIRKCVLTFIAACFYYSGLVKLARWWTKRSGQYLVILNYHRAIGGDLRRHLLYLRRHYRILHLEAALEELYRPPKERNWKQDQYTPLVLTFDDGYHDNYTDGFVLARELQIPITIFLIPGYIESGDYFWWGEGTRLVQRTQVDEVTIEGRHYCLKRPHERKVLAQAIDMYLRNATSVAEREAFLACVRKLLVVQSTKIPEEEPALPLTWAEIQQMEESECGSYGAHTMSNPILTYLTEPIEIEREIRECRTKLEQHLRHPVRTFAYPVGQPQHVSEAVLHTVKQAGYDWAVTTIHGFNTPRSDPYLLRRIEVDVCQHWLVVAAEAAGLWGFFSSLRRIPIVRKYFTGI